MSAAELRSNSGRSCLTVRLLSCGTYYNVPGYDANVQIHGEHYDGDHEHPIAFSAEGLFLPRAEVVRLLAAIVAWTDLSLQELAESPFEGSFLFEVPGQSVSLCFGARDDTLSERKVVLTIGIASGRFSTETVFVTDQSCLRQFAMAVTRGIDLISD